MKKRLYLLVTMLIACGALYAQTKTISGVISDAATGELLIGVNVSEPGTTNGTISNIDGEYTLEIAGNQVMFSYVGYTSQTIPVNQTQVLNVRLSSDLVLDEIVVVGYGVQRKSDLTGSISSISDKDLKNLTGSNVSQLLTGKASGVYVAASSGQPGADAMVRIRGFGTVNDNNPLYVVDGQPLDNINNLNPADIERIEVLKDASSAAIYGSRGSNGVILVTTKKGVSGQTHINLDAYVGVRSSYKALKMQNAEQYYNFITEAYANNNETLDPRFRNQYLKGYDTDWWDEVTRNAFNQNYNLSIRKGSENTRTSLSLGYLDEQGTIITTEFQRITLRLNNEYDLSSRVTIGTNIGLAKTHQRDAGSLVSFDFIQKADPFTPVISPLVDPSSENYGYNKYAPTEWSYDPNPVSTLELNDRFTNQFNVFGNAFASVKLLKGLSYRFQYSFERNNNEFKHFTPIYTATFSDDNLANTQSKSNDYTRLTHNVGNRFNQVFENRVNYMNSWGLHNLDAMVAITYEKNDYQTVNAFKAYGLNNGKNNQVLDAMTANDATSGSRESNSLMSYLGRVNYSFRDTYLATVSFRADGSSRFAKGNRWGYFPSFSLGWRITNEEFFKSFNNEDILSSLKIRVGWGQNGNQRIDNLAALTLVGTNNEKQWWFGNGWSQGYVPTYVGNSDIKWETSQQTNVGLDFNFFNSKLDVSADFYVKKTSDMLLQVPLPNFAAYTNNPWSNAGDLKNTGFEFVINYRDRVGDFGYNIGANLSTYKTKVTRLTADGEYFLTGDVSRTVVGGPLARFYGYKTLGIFQNEAEVQAHSKNGNLLQPNAKPGDFIFADLNDDGEITDEDRTFIGDPNPDLIYGFNLGFEYKNFDLSLFFQGTIGNDIWNGSKGTLSNPGRQNALEAAYTDAWRKDGDTNAKYPLISLANENNNLRGSDWFVEKGSYMRLQNIQLGYNLPSDLCRRSGLFSAFRIYVSAQNLFTITKYTGLDPELAGAGVDANGNISTLNMGLDNTRYPTSRIFTLGVNVQF